MPDDFTRLTDAVWRASLEHCNQYSGHVVSDRHGRAVVLAVLRELAAIRKARALALGMLLDDLIAQAEGGQEQ